MKKEEKFAISLYNDVIQSVPAYKNFLISNDLSPQKIRSIKQFKNLPQINKNNYLLKYSFKELLPTKQPNINMISVSSGSSGEPFFWPRGHLQTMEGIWFHEEIFKNTFKIMGHRTLVVICFSMGTWIAGTYTMSSIIGLSDKGYDINVITPGLEMDEAIRSIKRLAHDYTRVVLCGYPPYIKDVLSKGAERGVDWTKINTNLLLAGESFSEEWRDYVLEMIDKKNSHESVISIYGTADVALVGSESPVSILCRRLYNAKPKLMKEIFKCDILPSIVQFHPDKRFVEEVSGNIVITARSGIPLIRYDIKDTGRVMTFDEMVAPIKKEFHEEALKLGINIKDWKLPFITLNGRKDFTATIYAVNIYPENIKAALLEPTVRDWVTGKFTMNTKYLTDMDQFLEINIELADGIDASEQKTKQMTDLLLSKLKSLNAEFNKLHLAIADRAIPKVRLIPYGNESLFPKKSKHSWLNKEA